jgi:hypothetical protein
MSLLDWISNPLAQARNLMGKRAGDIDPKALTMPEWNALLERQSLPSTQAANLLSKASNDIERIIYSHQGRVIHKWTHYPEIYDRYFSRYRNTPVTMLEIGVFKGGSLELWRKYFGSAATIFGVDIDPACAEYVCAPNQVRIGSQADPDFLNAVIVEMGPPDIILDDGSHVGRHQEISFRTLFPSLKYGGLYIIEDLHTSYWGGAFEGGYKCKGSAIELVKQMIDDMHGWYHKHDTITPAKTDIGAIHMFDSIVIIEKAKRDAPFNIKVGAGQPS